MMIVTALLMACTLLGSAVAIPSTSVPSAVATSTGDDSTDWHGDDWHGVAQQELGSHLRAEPSWKRWVRDAGPLPWLILFWLPIPLGVRRMRQRRFGRPQVALIVVSGLLLTLAGGLAARVAGQLAAPPVRVRGNVETNAVAPPPGHLAIYAWGDSTMHGDVFAPQLTIPRVVQWALSDQARPLFIQNFARPGARIHEWRTSALADVLAAPERFHPAAILVYVGHNGGYPDQLAHRWVGDESDRQRDAIEADFNRELSALAQQVHAAGSVLIIALPTSNTEGHPPPGPRHGERVTAKQRVAYERQLDIAEGALATGEAERALVAIQAARKISPHHAWAAFMAGRALRQLGQDAAARVAFRRAHELDLDRQRSLPSQNQMIADLCAAGRAICVDAGAALRTEYPWLDDEAFIDLHHPVARGHLLIGLAFARDVSRQLHLGPAKPPPPSKTWPTDLNPAAQMRERYLQTFAWYWQLALKHRTGYPRAFEDAVHRARACLDALQPYARQAQGPSATRLRRRVAVARLLLAALAGNRAETRRRMAALHKAYPGATTADILPQSWMRDVVRDFLD